MSRFRSKQWTRRTTQIWKQANARANQWPQIFYRAAIGFTGHEGFMSAAAIAYYAFLSLFPFSVLLLAIGRRLLEPVEAMNQYRAFLDHYLPGANEFLRLDNSLLQGRLTVLRLVALLTLIWSGSGIFAATGRLLDRAWGIKHSGRLWLRRRMLALPMAAVAAILVAVSLVMSALWKVLNHLEFFDGIGWFTHIISLVIILGLNTLFFALVYSSLPSAQVKWRDVLPGAILASFLWEGAKYAFSLYLSNLSLFNVVYGSVAAIAAFLIWAYLSGAIVLFCGELNAEYSRHEHVARLLRGKTSESGRRG